MPLRQCSLVPELGFLGDNPGHNAFALLIKEWSRDVVSPHFSLTILLSALERRLGTLSKSGSPCIIACE